MHSLDSPAATCCWYERVAWPARSIDTCSSTVAGVYLLVDYQSLV
eukprot:COSAG01_NODE_31295_length_600_cov_0.978044_1_plen_44_part_10